MPVWQHVISARKDTHSAINAGHKRICVTSPTGMGKTQMMIDQIEDAESNGGGSILFTNRKMLLEQTLKGLREHGFDPGVRAAGYEPALLRSIQLAMVQSELSQVYCKERRELHRAKLVLIDEIHNQTGPGTERIIEDYVQSGATVLMYTATPIGIGDLARHLVVAGTNSIGRACGALVPAVHYGPDEPDLRYIRNYRLGDDITEKQNVKAIMRPGVFGRVFRHYKKYNPGGFPALGFGPDVAGSLFFAKEFDKAGVKSAHIDGEKIWFNDTFYDATQEMRDELANLSRTGRIEIVWNRFVLREGINWPWLQHAVLGTVFGSMTSYLQSCGRMLRASPG
ncbi:MAG TPA: DEAD/DEAH box helicase family protein, partial [Terriglobales bacterium]|nr:DEAD/DEAH box helicase family protein [Terriglobales bacterium]